MKQIIGLCGIIVFLAMSGEIYSAEDKIQESSASQKKIQQAIESASKAAALGQSKEAVKWASVGIELSPENAGLYYLRGREHFRIGKFKESVADFDQYVKLQPKQASRQWERGISCYYAEMYQAGADQFKLYQSYHDNDVENSVWRYLCVARAQTVEKARKTILPIKNDSRIPMMTLLAMYRGDATPADVLKEIEQGEPTAAERAGRKFYADLYLGLFFEANGQPQKARKHIAAAADKQIPIQAQGRINTYMWDVARVHHERLQNVAKK
ncbi:MAG: tetratricopeptide repeat protein [Pirellulales bacterium]